MENVCGTTMVVLWIITHFQKRIRTDWRKKIFDCYKKWFNDMINAINKITISHNCIGLFSWLIDRSFKILPTTVSNKNKVMSKLNMNKSIMLKVLFDINSSNLLKCFSKNCWKCTKFMCSEAIPRFNKYRKIKVCWLLS